MIYRRCAQSELVSTRKDEIIDFRNLFEGVEADVIKSVY